MNPLSIIAILPAAGTGSRMSHQTPKAYLPLWGKPLIYHAIDALQSQRLAVVVAIHPDHQPFYSQMQKDFPELMLCDGGATRQQSVYHALDFIMKTVNPVPSHVLIHDAARPFLRQKLLERLRQTSQQSPESAVIPGIPLRDTVRQTKACGTTSTLPRTELSLIQTPQIFPLRKIYQLHQKYQQQDFTDDAALFEQEGLNVKIIAGDIENVKITYPQDLPMNSPALNNTQTLAEYRTAQGFDVHGFCPGDALTLCGVTLPFDYALAGHSDADVALHAITDAILGSIALGDIGMHFPPSDPQWKDAPSKIFLRHACQLLLEQQARLIFCDLTLICERPKLRPLYHEMREQLSQLLDLPVTRISLKATTTEKLGFTGREEGIAALANVTIALPASWQQDSS